MFEFLQLKHTLMVFELFNPELWPNVLCIIEIRELGLSCILKFLFPSGVNTVTSLVESKKAQLVIIAHDVDPIEVSSPDFGLLDFIVVTGNDV